MLKKTLLLLSILTLLLTASTSHILSQQESTDSGTTSVQEIQKSLQERIKKAIQGSNEATTEPKLKAFVGTVTSIAENTITISATNQDVKHATVSTDTAIVRSGSNIKLDSVKINEGIIAMGLTSDLQTQEAIRIVLFETAQPKTSRQVIIGNLEVDGADLTLTPLGGSSPLKFTLTSAVSLLNKDHKKIKAADLNSGIRAIAIISTNLQTQKQTLFTLITLDDTQASSPTPVRSTCGDKVCQNIVCQGIGCPQPETPETCPVDCTN